MRPFAALRGAPDRVAATGDPARADVVVPPVVLPSHVAGRVVVLVDDVVTSGATVAAVGGVLARHGAIVLAAAVGRAGARGLGATPDEDAAD